MVVQPCEYTKTTELCMESVSFLVNELYLNKKRGKPKTYRHKCLLCLDHEIEKLEQWKRP